MNLLVPIKSIWNRLMASESKENQKHIEDLLISLLNMAWFVEARDPYTGGHLWRVSRYALLLAEAASLKREVVAQVCLGGFLHDLGKIAVPDAILRKADKLSDDEYSVIRTHPQAGKNLLSGHPLAHIVNDAVLLHHERPDGRGYPLGLSAKDIPEIAKIVSLCDAFDAMTSHRPYRIGMPSKKALAIISEAFGTQFDPYFGQFFMALADTGKFEHIIGHSDQGIPLQKCPMCGPTIVIRRENTVGDYVYCRNCAGEFLISENSDSLMASPTGRQGEPHQLTPVAEVSMIKSVTHQFFDLAEIDDILSNLNSAKKQSDVS